MSMMFNITKGSTLPYLRMEAINDGRSDFRKLYLAMQSADVTFSMTDANTGIKKIANAKAYIVEKDDDGSCEEGYLMEYRWNKRDTNQSGTFLGQFRIKFDDDVVMDGLNFPKGEMFVPMAEDLVITISDGMIK